MLAGGRIRGSLLDVDRDLERLGRGMIQKSRSVHRHRQLRRPIPAAARRNVSSDTLIGGGDWPAACRCHPAAVPLVPIKLRRQSITYLLVRNRCFDALSSPRLQESECLSLVALSTSQPRPPLTQGKSPSYVRSTTLPLSLGSTAGSLQDGTVGALNSQYGGLACSSAAAKPNVSQDGRERLSQI
ncbi:hypothetical protein BO70DRAFT_10855 [Aspergillus heteromorphus CBS 117.55]|uniref:Uncharacterized protein n=1 Tax=Aspergillus heteromorphus CBS 117.55 TaxID=1448321 RepID=A0A317X1K6_9EURO|nr:uncharacterized protein BO70DRAFT_10855 [Aspergillus heteromorphus CBS 117.55]PWY92456.1 hypothetical protein BO70DRAFT_10855 [Aspergillus heteromorphus CBS 117.55]